MIDADIEETGEFRNRSEWVLTAVRFYMDYRTKLIAERKEVFKKLEDNKE